MKNHTTKQPQYKTIPEIAAELTLLTAQVDAHRLVLAWLLRQMPNDAGHSFLSTQADIFDTEGKNQHADLIAEELDELRLRVVALSGVEPLFR